MEENKMKDLIIIGSGPAGMGAAVYAKRAGLEVLVMEKAAMSGGQILNTYEVDNYLGLPGINGFELGMKFHEHSDSMEVEFVQETVTSIQIADGYYIVETDANNKISSSNAPDLSLQAAEMSEATYTCKTVLIATGTTYQKLQVPGEIEFLGKGVSYCATCDGAFFRNKEVAVVGGGDVAVEDAIFLARICKKVHLIHRRDSLRAAKMLQNKLFETSNIEVIWDTTVSQIKGTTLVEELDIVNKETKKETSLKVQGVFIAVGIKPNTDQITLPVALDQAGYIIAGEDGVTDVPGIFVAGDIRTKQLRQVITAVSDGANAITSIESYLLTL